MNTQLSALAYEVGQKVRLLKDVYEPPGETPGGLYARRGEILFVRSVAAADSAYPLAISHEDVLDSSFGVTLDEVEAV